MGSALARAVAAAAALLFGAAAWAAPLEVNVANQAELEQIKGLGPQRVDVLLAERRAHGAFSSWADLQRRIKGIGPATARKLSEAGLVVGGKAYGADAAEAPDAAGSVPTR